MRFTAQHTRQDTLPTRPGHSDDRARRSASMCLRPGSGSEVARTYQNQKRSPARELRRTSRLFFFIGLEHHDEIDAKVDCNGKVDRSGARAALLADHGLDDVVQRDDARRYAARRSSRPGAARRRRSRRHGRVRAAVLLVRPAARRQDARRRRRSARAGATRSARTSARRCVAGARARRGHRGRRAGRRRAVAASSPRADAAGERGADLPPASVSSARRWRCVYVALREVRYGEGDARSPMVATVIANVVNIALAYAFVVQPHWGVAGAAWATVIAHTRRGGRAGRSRSARDGFGIRRDAAARHVRELWRDRPADRAAVHARGRARSRCSRR